MAIEKKGIVRSARLFILIVVGLLVAASVYGSVLTYRAVDLLPDRVNKQEPVYNYNHNGAIDYKVYLKPNSIIKDNPAGPGKTYYTRLLDHISLSYSYLFHADRETALSGTYSITASMDAKDMWQKEFILVPPTSFSNKGKDFSFTHSYDLDLTPMDKYLSMANQELGVPTPDPKVTVKVVVNIQGDTPAGSVQGSVGPSITIPLNAGQFTIDDKKATDEKKDSISKTVTVPDPNLGQRKSRLLYLAIASIVLALFFVFLILFTEGKPLPPVDPEAVIQKKYGNRLVKVPGEIQLGEHQTVVSFNIIDELVKIADELGKPLVKSGSALLGRVNYFVFDGQVVYKYVLTRELNSFQSNRAGVPFSG